MTAPAPFITPECNRPRPPPPARPLKPTWLMSVGHRQATKEAITCFYLSLQLSSGRYWCKWCNMQLWHIFLGKCAIPLLKSSARVFVTRSEQRKQKHGPELEKKKFDKRRIRLVLHHQQTGKSDTAHEKQLSSACWIENKNYKISFHGGYKQPSPPPAWTGIS